MPRATPVNAATFMLVLALATILGAWGFQIIGGYVPCKLCLEERIPYYVGTPLLALSLVALLTGRSPALARTLMGLAALVFLVGAAMGVYHAGAEWGWWNGPADCGTGGGGAATSTADLLAQIEKIRVVSCSEASWRFPPGWGLSFAGWNAVIAGLLAFVGLRCSLRGKWSGA